MTGGQTGGMGGGQQGGMAGKLEGVSFFPPVLRIALDQSGLPPANRMLLAIPTRSLTILVG